jgi:hypothetical protein
VTGAVITGIAVVAYIAMYALIILMMGRRLP